MDFTKVSVLIDSHNLALPSGTGIKNYGLTLLAALDRLGVRAELLANSRSSGDPLVAQALLHEGQPTPVEGISLVTECLRHWFGVRRTAEHVVVRGKWALPIPNDVFPFGRDCSVSPFIFDNAIAVQEWLGFPVRFRTRQPYDLWHATMPHPLEPTGMRQITTVHDLIPLVQPHTCPAHRGAFAQHVRLAVRNSRVIAAVSEHTKRDLQHYFDVPDEKIVVTHQPTFLENWSPQARVRASVLRQFGLEPGGYILYVGNIEPKKNVGRLIRAYLALGTDLPLVIVGRKAWMWEDDLAPLAETHSDAAKQVRLLGHVNGEWLPYLYESAYCMVFPSLYEGFGLPVLEALTLGCPVVCSRSSSLPEVGGDAVEYVDAHDTASITAGIDRLLRDRPYRDSLAARGREQAKLFSMERYTAKVAELYEKALS